MLAPDPAAAETDGMGDEVVPAGGPDPAELGGLAVVFHRLADDQRGLLDFLDTSLSTAMPEAVRVQRDHMFNRGRANHVEILLGGRVFDLRLEHGAITSSQGDVVGGVALSRMPCAIEAWIDDLLVALDAAARASDSVRAALAKLT